MELQIAVVAAVDIHNGADHLAVHVLIVETHRGVAGLAGEVAGEVADRVLDVASDDGEEVPTLARHAPALLKHATEGILGEGTQVPRIDLGAGEQHVGLPEGDGISRSTEPLTKTTGLVGDRAGSGHGTIGAQAGGLDVALDHDHGLGLRTGEFRGSGHTLGVGVVDTGNGGDGLLQAADAGDAAELLDVGADAVTGRREVGGIGVGDLGSVNGSGGASGGIGIHEPLNVGVGGLLGAFLDGRRQDGFLGVDDGDDVGEVFPLADRIEIACSCHSVR